MSIVASVLARIPEPYRSVAIKHRELLKFLVVGGTTWVIDTATNYALKLTVLTEKPVTARIFAVVIATIASYILNREWSFRTRGGRERHHEAALFFIISGAAVGLTVVPLAVSRYLLHLQVADGASRVVQEVADFVAGQIIGVLIAMFFRFWAFKKWVFPQENVRGRHGSVSAAPELDEELGHS